ncbi:ATP phosphoribosyltransferase [Cyphellophora attinorum]|uniref:ATP phosphoribosyltransferase n=1 Tax=Cyphellophora attinorum TaxID=1664694 RepID=A0A0N0NSI9_9EURO|nr:ATP phosphoribosyltransferase [Phialophora attinorum]KPI46049.1 ATP phosphoribosyltransferase [Phialophora attinorum]
MEGLVKDLPDRLLFAVPKKGRLQQATLDLLSGSDIQFRREARLDIALVKNHPMALVFLPAADIPTFVGEGKVDLGITGLDQVAEHDAHLPLGQQSGVEQIMDLGFGRCKLQVQVPENGSIQEVKDLVGKNIATSFTGLAEDYFARLEGKGSRKESVNGTMSPVPKLKTNIRSLGGSVEAACALGVADGIVDLVESGETMRAAKLKAIDTVVESSAVLIKARKVSDQRLVDVVAARIRGVITAQRYVLCIYNAPRAKMDQMSKITPGRTAPTVQALEQEGWVAISVMVEKSKIATVMDDLAAAGATDILVTAIANSRAAGS